jgi:nitrate/nitrite transport system permease protein
VVLGLYPTLYRAVNPYIQIMKPISPLAWMPLFLYTIKNSAWAAVMVVFMSSIWPTLANTAFGVISIKRDYLNVSSLLQLSWLSCFFKVILPAAAPAIVAGLRFSIGGAWIGLSRRDADRRHRHRYRLNEWNNLQLTSVTRHTTIGGVSVIGRVRAPGKS